MTPQKQAILRFAHPCGVLGSSQWRQALKAKPALEGINFDDLAVTQSAMALSLIARTPLASELMHERVMDLMRSVADVAGRTLTVEMLDLTPAVAFTNHRWSYIVPKWVVARPKDEWAPWREPELGTVEQKKMSERLMLDLGRQLDTWTGSHADFDLVIEDFGKPMVLKSAVANGPKPVSALARLNVLFSSSHRLEGALFAGFFGVTGFGRIFRSGYQES